MSRPKSLLPYFIIACLVQIAWGFTPSASKFVIDEISVELYIAIRWTISGLIFWFYVGTTKSWKKISISDLVVISVLGILGYGVASFGTLYGMKIGGVTNFALMSSVSPIISSSLAIVLLKERPRAIYWVALPLSVIGLLSLVAGKYQMSSMSIAGVSALLIIAAYFCEGLVFVFSKKLKKEAYLSQYLAISQTSAALFMWLLQVTAFDQIHEVEKLSSQGVLGIGFVSVVSCVLCFASMYWLLNFLNGHQLALFDSLHVVSAALFGYLLFNEAVYPLMFIGGGFILVGLVLGNLPQKIASQDPD